MRYQKPKKKLSPQAVMQKRKDYQEDYDREMLEKLKEKHLELKQRREYNKKHKIVVPPEDRDPNGAFI
jgi:hypothetical protein